MENLSLHCTYKEATYSQTGVKKGIDNTPNEVQLSNIKKLLERVFEPVRKWHGNALYISSLFRSKKLNTYLGGALSSQHLCDNGAAMDIDADVYGGLTNKQLFLYIKDNLEFDQLILEDIDKRGEGQWVHVSYNEGKNRGEVWFMQLIKQGKKTIKKYIPYGELKP